MAALMDFDEALRVAAQLGACTPCSDPVPLRAAEGRVLGEAVAADRDLPPFNRAAMDGYALAHSTSPAPRPVVGDVRAGDEEAPAVPHGSCVTISTGAAVPHDCDTVVPIECTDRGNPMRITGDLPAPGRHIHARGEDVKHGATVLHAGTRLGPAEIGIAAMVGCDCVQVRRRPTVAILTSGDEVVQTGAVPTPHRIRNSNGPMVTALVHRIGGEATETTHLRDDRASVGAAIERAAADVIVTTGGISMGRHDHIAAALEAAGTNWQVQGVAMQPGKPARLGLLGERIVVCLPGNPVSALVTAAVFLAPVLRARLGLPPGPRWRPVRVAETITCNPKRTLLRPACTPEPGTALVPVWHGSGDLVHAADTRGLVRLPMASSAAAGTEVPFTRWP